MGSVYKALNESNGRLVAIKIMRPAAATDALALRRFNREIELTKTLKHSNIVEACVSAPALKLAEPLTLRRGSTNITTLLRAQACDEDTFSGSAVAKLEIAERGDYRIEIQ